MKATEAFVTVTVPAPGSTGVKPVAVSRSRTAASLELSVCVRTTISAYGYKCARGTTSLARPEPDHDSFATAGPASSWVSRRCISGLTAPDLTIVEDGVPQTPAYLLGEPRPPDVVLLIDTSASLERRGVGYTRHQPVDGGRVHHGVHEDVGVPWRRRPARGFLPGTRDG